MWKTTLAWNRKRKSRNVQHSPQYVDVFQWITLVAPDPLLPQAGEIIKCQLETRYPERHILGISNTISSGDI